MDAPRYGTTGSTRCAEVAAEELAGGVPKSATWSGVSLGPTSWSGLGPFAGTLGRPSVPCCGSRRGGDTRATEVDASVAAAPEDPVATDVLDVAERLGAGDAPGPTPRPEQHEQAARPMARSKTARSSCKYLREVGSTSASIDTAPGSVEKNWRRVLSDQSRRSISGSVSCANTFTTFNV